MGKKEKAYNALAVMALVAVAIPIFRISLFWFFIYLGAALIIFFSMRIFIFSRAGCAHEWNGCKCSKIHCNAIKQINDPSHCLINCVCEECGIVWHTFEDATEVPGEKCSVCGFIYKYSEGHKRFFATKGTHGDREELHQVVKDPKTGNLVWECISQKKPSSS